MGIGTSPPLEDIFLSLTFFFGGDRRAAAGRDQTHPVL